MIVDRKCHHGPDSSGQVRNKITVLVVDDREIARLGLKRILNMAPDIVVTGEAGSGGQAITLTGRLQPDVIVADIRVCEEAGILVDRFVRKVSPGTRTLILLSYDEFQHVSSPISLGADGCVLKSCSADELIEAVHLVHNGWLVFSPSLAERLVMQVLSDGGNPSALMSVCRRTACESSSRWKVGRLLTPREAEVLDHMCRGLRNSEIADCLGIARKTVEVHIPKVLLKVGAKNRTEAVANVLKPYQRLAECDFYGAEAVSTHETGGGRPTA